jgi:hypothetical protein
MGPLSAFGYRYLGNNTRKGVNCLQSFNSAIKISEGYILPYWNEHSAQQLLSMFMKNNSQKDQDM